MKRYFCFFVVFLFVLEFVAPAKIFADTVGGVGVETSAKKSEQSSDDVEEYEEESEHQKRIETLNFGLESDITSLVDTLMKEDDRTYTDNLKNAFDKTRNVKVREKILQYFTKIEDASFTDYCVSILEDPYDEKKSTVSLVFNYVSTLKITEAREAVLNLIKNENEDYYDSAIATLGKIGTGEDAVYLTEMLDAEDLTVGRKQALMRSLGELKAVETYDKMVEIAKDTEENSFVRSYAAEAIGNMGKEEGVDVLVELFEESDNNLRTTTVKALANFVDNENARSVLLDAFKDNYYKIRLEAATAAKKNKMKDAVPYLLFRAKKDPENSVKFACYEALGAIKTDDAEDFLISVVKDNRASETARAKAAAVLLENDSEKAYDPIFAVARKTLADDKLKNLRYALGKEFAKYENPRFEDICRDYIAHKDVATKGTGLDIFAKNNYAALRSDVRRIAADEKEGANKRKARHVLEKTGNIIKESSDNPQSDPKTESKAKSDSDATPKSDATPESEPKTESNAKSDSDAKPKSEPKTTPAYDGK